MPLPEVLSNIDANRPGILDGLKQLLRIPSVSTNPDNAGECQRCADWLAGRSRAMGLAALVEPTDRHSIVLATLPQLSMRRWSCPLP